MEDRLLHGNDILKQLCLEGGSPRSYPRVKSMQSVMALDGRKYPAIYDDVYRLPHDLHQANPYDVGASSLGDHHHRLKGTRRCKLSSPEERLYDDNNLLPVPWVGVFLPRIRAKPHPEVFGSHYG